MSDDQTTVHIVEQGEHLREIALRHGTSAELIWGHPSNKGLKNAGRTPEVLAPMDVVYVPKGTRKFLPVSVGTTNGFIAKVPSVSVVFRLSGRDGKPLASEPFEVRELKHSGTTEGDGAIRLKAVPFTVKAIEVHLTKRDLKFHVKIGHLDPVTTPRGLAQRLAHLGYLPSHGLGVPGDSLASALAHFLKAEAPKAETVEDIQKALLSVHVR